MNEWFCTVFPNDLDEMPQDFESYAVFVRREGVAYIQAENEDEAYAAAEDMEFKDISWDDYYTLENVQEE